MTLSSGTRLGPYEILSPLGAGGMGEVYRSMDAKLNREVAIKVLPESLSKDPDALTRFEREARAVAALNHPNILSIFDFGSHDGIAYAVTELLEGETLRELLSGGAIPVRQGTEIARQIAAGLAAAHGKGIVHRDLKPENLFVTNDGRVKILDFGLAKPMVKGHVSDQTHSPTESAFTQPGTVMGTAGYMSPEQVKGLPVDHRSDIFSFGTVLYEMLTGRRAFQRDTAAETMTAILREDPPDPAATERSVSPALDRTIRRCLEKKPDQRFQSASDLGFALETATGASSPSRPSTPVSRIHVSTVVAAVAVLAVAVVLSFVLLLRRREPPAPSVEQVARLTHDAGISEWPTWSPDGSLVAFASNRSGNFEIYVRRVDGGQEVNISNDPAEDFQPSFSPDGKSIAFVSTRSSRTGIIHTGAAFGFQFRTMGGDLWVAPALGGRARRLASDGNAPAWDPSGKRIAYVSGPEFHRSILEAPLEGGAPRTILANSDSRFEITRLHYSPSGAWVSFETAPDGELYLIPTRGGQPHSLLPRAASHAWDAKNGQIYYLNQEPSGGTRLQTVAIDETTGRAAAKPQAVALMTGILRDTAVLGDGRQIAIAELEGSFNLTRLPMKPDGTGPSGPEEPLSTGHVLDRYPAVSPDGRRIAYGSDRLGSQDLWIYDRETHRSERLELPGKDYGVNEPHWSPDGRRLALTRLIDQKGKGSVWLVAPDGSQSEELTTIEGLFSTSGPFSPNGRELLYINKSAGWNQVFAFDTATRRTRQITSTPSDKYDGAWSPDGEWIAFEKGMAEKYGLIRIPSAGGDEKVLAVSNERLRHDFVSRDGRWVYVQPSHRNIWRVPAEGGAMQQVTHFPESGLFIEEPTIAPDGSYLAYCRSNGGSSLWLLTIGTEKGR